MIIITFFFISFYLLLISVIGFGFLFQNICFGAIKDLEDQKIIYIGFYGLFSLTIISLITSLFVPHDFIHNLLLHLFGILFFIFHKFEYKKEYLKIIFIISLFTISALLISKTHDDFSYYHLPFTKYLTEHKIIFGMGNLLHGYKLLSSLFFLNSTFYLPIVEYYSFHFSLLFFLIFFNFFLFKEIVSKATNEVLKFLYIFTFMFFNLSFNRIAEYGTDKVGQLLIVILIIKIFQISCFNKSKTNTNNFLLLMPLLAFCISLKTYFLPYILFGLVIFFLNKKFIKTFKIIFFSKSFLFFLLSLSFYFFHHFVSTGCIISPLSATCFGDNLDWAHSKAHYERLSNWLEQWSKAGAGPNFRIENPITYIQNFNWVSRWFEFYFMGKVKDQLLLLVSIFLVIFILFKKFKLKSKSLILDKKILFFYGIIIVIFFIWFTNHPQLRYGGYSISFLAISIPLVLFFQKFENKNFFDKKFKYLFILTIIFFNIKNFTRINDEFKRTDHYKFNNFPFFSIPEKQYDFETTRSGLKIYKTIGHCWNIPSPCVQSLDKLTLKTIKKNGYYFIYR